MYTLLFCLVFFEIIPLFFFLRKLKKHDIFYDHFVYIVSWVLGFFIMILAPGILGWMIGNPQEEKFQEIHLVAFKDGQSVKGSFYLGCGSVQGASIYSYYTERSDGGIIQGSVYADSSIIYEQNRNDAVLEVWLTKTAYGKWENFVFEHNPAVHNKFLVPKGTVVRRFVADLS